MTRLQRTAAIAAGFGLAVGVAAAVAVPRTTGAPVRERPFAKLPGPVKNAPSRALERSGIKHAVALRPKDGTVREEVRRADPAGGAPWVLRSFVADRLAPIGGGRQR
ncbi:MAG: hypothetical protein Q7T55_10160, partial [Solirubrobacteraceae bacterium]|nr:hypothetical protein [Solirubrobacteraceae bacterium]